jgi:ferritin-like protein
VVDFVKIREEYITGESVQNIATRHRVSVDTIREFCRRNKLGAEKRAIQAATHGKIMKQHQMDVVNELAIINGRDVAISNRLRDLMAKKLQEIETSEDIPINDLATLARTHKDVQHVARIALDANSEAIRTELLSKKDLRDYTEAELLQILANKENEEESSSSDEEE